MLFGSACLLCFRSSMLSGQPTKMLTAWSLEPRGYLLLHSNMGTRSDRNSYQNRKKSKNKNPNNGKNGITALSLHPVRGCLEGGTPSAIATKADTETSFQQSDRRGLVERFIQRGREKLCRCTLLASHSGNCNGVGGSLCSGPCGFSRRQR